MQHPQMLRLTKILYQTSPCKNIAITKRTLQSYLVFTHPETGCLVFHTVRPVTTGIFAAPYKHVCCVGQGIKSWKYGEMIYAHRADELFVNLFIPSALQWEEQQTEIIQENNFPCEAETRITVNPRRKKEFTIHLRHPEWVKEGAFKITVNGKAYPLVQKNGYVSVKRKWKKGDKW